MGKVKILSAVNQSVIQILQAVMRVLDFPPIESERPLNPNLRHEFPFGGGQEMVADLHTTTNAPIGIKIVPELGTGEDDDIFIIGRCGIVQTPDVQITAGREFVIEIVLVPRHRELKIR